jgi:hypothetical protein
MPNKIEKNNNNNSSKKEKKYIDRITTGLCKCRCNVSFGLRKEKKKIPEMIIISYVKERSTKM